REGRAASDGLVAGTVVETDGGATGILVEVNCETDFVTKNDKFLALAESILEAAVASGAEDAESLLAAPAGDSTVQALVDDAAATLGEKLVVRRVARVSGEKVELYLHKVSKDLPPQVGVLVAADAGGA